MLARMSMTDIADTFAAGAPSRMESDEPTFHQYGGHRSVLTGDTDDSWTGHSSAASNPAGASLSVQEQFDYLCRQYNPALYSYGLFDCMDIVYHATLAGLVPDTAVKTSIASWFLHPAIAWKHPGALIRAVGEERWQCLQQVLRRLLSEHDETIAPVTRFTSTAPVLDAAQWTTFLRSIVSVGLLTPESAMMIPFVVEAAVAGELRGRGQIQASAADRAHWVAKGLLEAAVEYGSNSMLDLSLELHRKHRLPTDYATMRRVEQCIQKAGRRSLDWNLRSSGRLVQALPRWFRDHYATMYKKSHSKREHPLDAAAALQGDHASTILDSRATSSVMRWSEDELATLREATMRDLRAAAAGAVGNSSQHDAFPLSCRDAASSSSTSVPQPRGLVTDSAAPSAYFAGSIHRHGAASNALQKAILRQSVFEESMESLGMAESRHAIAENTPLQRIHNRITALTSPIA